MAVDGYGYRLPTRARRGIQFSFVNRIPQSAIFSHSITYDLKRGSFNTLTCDVKLKLSLKRFKVLCRSEVTFLGQSFPPVLYTHSSFHRTVDRLMDGWWFRILYTLPLSVL